MEMRRFGHCFVFFLQHVTATFPFFCVGGELRVAGYLNLAADFTHNFTDGLAIGEYLNCNHIDFMRILNYTLDGLSPVSFRLVDFGEKYWICRCCSYQMWTR